MFYNNDSDGSSGAQKDGEEMNYRVIDKEKYYRKGVYEHFTKDCKCSTSMTARIDVTALKEYSDKMPTKFYINFLYLLSKVLNSRDDYKMGYFWETDELVCYDQIHPTQYIFHEDTETCTPVYTTYYEDYSEFYKNCENDRKKAKETSPRASLKARGLFLSFTHCHPERMAPLTGELK